MGLLKIDTFGNIDERSVTLYFHHSNLSKMGYMMDDGNGNLLSVQGAVGVGIIDYATGKITLDLIKHYEDSEVVRVMYRPTGSRDRVTHDICYDEDKKVIDNWVIVELYSGAINSYHFMTEEEFNTFRYMQELVY